MEYFDESDEADWLIIPQFDIYDLCEKISGSTDNFDETTRTKADEIMTAVDDMVIYSYGGSYYTGFTEGRNGLSIFFPDGDRIYEGNCHWAYLWWYNSIDTVDEFGEGFEYGCLKWCQDNQDPETNQVGNWFEMLDAWYDTSNEADGGLNGYQC